MPETPPSQPSVSVVLSCSDVGCPARGTAVLELVAFDSTATTPQSYRVAPPPGWRVDNGGALCPLHSGLAMQPVDGFLTATPILGGWQLRPSVPGLAGALLVPGQQIPPAFSPFVEITAGALEAEGAAFSGHLALADLEAQARAKAHADSVEQSRNSWAERARLLGDQVDNLRAQLASADARIVQVNDELTRTCIARDEANARAKKAEQDRADLYTVHELLRTHARELEAKVRASDERVRAHVAATAICATVDEANARIAALKLDGDRPSMTFPDRVNLALAMIERLRDEIGEITGERDLWKSTAEIETRGRAVDQGQLGEAATALTGAREALDASIAIRDAERARRIDVEQVNAGLRAQVSSLQGEVAGEKSNVAHLGAELAAAHDAANVARDTLEAANEKLGAELRAQDAELAANRARLRELDEELGAAHEQARRAEQSRQDTGRRVVELEEELRNLRTDRDHHAAKVLRQRERIVYLEGATQHAEGTPLTQARRDLARANERIAKLERDVADLNTIATSNTTGRVGAEEHMLEVARVRTMLQVRIYRAAAFLRHNAEAVRANVETLRDFIAQTIGILTVGDADLGHEAEALAEFNRLEAIAYAMAAGTTHDGYGTGSSVFAIRTSPAVEAHVAHPRGTRDPGCPVCATSPRATLAQLDADAATLPPASLAANNRAREALGIRQIAGDVLADAKREIARLEGELLTRNKIEVGLRAEVDRLSLLCGERRVDRDEAREKVADLERRNEWLTRQPAALAQEIDRGRAAFLKAGVRILGDDGIPNSIAALVDELAASRDAWHFKAQHNSAAVDCLFDTLTRAMRVLGDVVHRGDRSGVLPLAEDVATQRKSTIAEVLGMPVATPVPCQQGAEFGDVRPAALRDRRRLPDGLEDDGAEGPRARDAGRFPARGSAIRRGVRAHRPARRTRGTASRARRGATAPASARPRTAATRGSPSSRRRSRAT
jgi:hypothetical protein